LGLPVCFIDISHGALATEAENGGRDPDCQGNHNNRGQADDLGAWH
jgi:hypothetical protein